MTTPCVPTIVLPLAGGADRFRVHGGEAPLHRLPLTGQSVFAHAVRSFARYFRSHRFLFVAHEDEASVDFVIGEVGGLGLRAFGLQTVPRTVVSPVDAVRLGVDGAELADSDAITVFSPERFRPGFEYPTAGGLLEADGFVEATAAQGAREPRLVTARGPGRRLGRRTGRARTSGLVPTGLYHFARVGDFRAALAHLGPTRSPVDGTGATSFSPVVDALLTLGRDVRYAVVPGTALVRCDSPAAYEALSGLRASRAA